MRRRTALLVPLGLVAGCSAGTDDEPDITVLAAASLTEAFTEIAQRFEADHPGIRVRLSFGGSSALAELVRSGAPADVVAFAATGPMQRLSEAGLVERPTVFARNQIVVAVPRANPGRVETVTDLPRVTVALCQAQVPCGQAAQQLLASAGVELTPVTLEPDVKAVLTKVSLGEVDAGLVYATDVRASGGKVATIDQPPGVGASTDYPIATVLGSRQADMARQFIGSVLSDEGRRALTAAGFQGPGHG